MWQVEPEARKGSNFNAPLEGQALHARGAPIEAQLNSFPSRRSPWCSAVKWAGDDKSVTLSRNSKAPSFLRSISSRFELAGALESYYNLHRRAQAIATAGGLGGRHRPLSNTAFR